MTKTARSRCRHQVSQIVEYHALGAAVECLHCGVTFDINGEDAENNYYPFTYTSPYGQDKDIDLLIHRRLIQGEVR